MLVSSRWAAKLLRKICSLANFFMPTMRLADDKAHFNCRGEVGLALRVQISVVLSRALQEMPSAVQHFSPGPRTASAMSDTLSALKITVALYGSVCNCVKHLISSPPHVMQKKNRTTTGVC